MKTSDPCNAIAQVDLLPGDFVVIKDGGCYIPTFAEAKAGHMPLYSVINATKKGDMALLVLVGSDIDFHMKEI